MGGQTALPMAGSGQQTGGTALGGTPIGGTPGQMGQPGMGQIAKVMPFLPGQQPGSTPRNIDTLPADFSPNPASQQILERLYQSGPMMTPEQVANMPGPSLAHVYQPSASNQTAQLEAARNMMQGMPGQMGMGGQDPRLIGGGPAPDYGAMIQRQSGNPGMGQPTPLAGMTQQQLQQHYGLFPAAQPAGQPGMGQPFPGMGQPGMGRSPGMPAAPPGSHERFLQGLTGGQLQEALQGQLAKTAEINARANSGQPGTPPGLGVTQQQLQQLQRAQASPMQRPEMAGGMPQQRPGFNMPQRFQDRLPPQFSQGLGALAQNMRNRFK